MMEDQYHNDESIRVDWEERFEEKYEEAGDLAFCNQFCFALDTEQHGENEPMWIITPIENGTDHIWDGHVPYGPGFGFNQAQEGQYEYYGLEKSRPAIANSLMNEGYVFDKGFQENMDAQHINLTSPLYKPPTNTFDFD